MCLFHLKLLSYSLPYYLLMKKRTVTHCAVSIVHLLFFYCVCFFFKALLYLRCVLFDNVPIFQQFNPPLHLGILHFILFDPVVIVTVNLVPLAFKPSWDSRCSRMFFVFLKPNKAEYLTYTATITCIITCNTPVR